MRKCTSCGKEVVGLHTQFKCPSCSKTDITRCDSCRSVSAKYTCSKCDFRGP